MYINMTDKKNLIEIFFMPIVVAAVGILGTYLITQQQESNALAMADSDRQVKILEIFAEKITSDDSKQRLLAIKLLRVLDDELAEKLALAVAEAEPDKSVLKEAATKVADVAKARIELRPRIYVHVEGQSEKQASLPIEQILEKHEWIVPGIQMVGTKSPKSSQLRYFRKEEKSTAEKIRNSLINENYEISLKYISGYEKSEALRPMHFEIWFAPGKPENNP